MKKHENEAYSINSDQGTTVHLKRESKLLTLIMLNTSHLHYTMSFNIN